jgi:cytoskeletal protein CcmA (bactofilin family)
MNKKVSFKVFSVLALLLITLLVFVPAAYAFDGRSGDKIEIGAGEIVNDDLYVGADTFVMDGTVNGDVVAAGSAIVINGTVDGDVIAAGKTITINGTVTGSARIAGMALTLGPNAKIGKDVMGAAYSLETKVGSSIGKDLVYAGYQLFSGGDVARNMNMGAEGAEINGKVGGYVKAEVGDASDKKQDSVRFSEFMKDVPPMPSVNPGLKLGDNAKIFGTLTYTSKDDAAIPASVITGEVTHLMPKPEKNKINEDVPATPQALAVGWALNSIRYLVALLIVALLGAWLLPTWVKQPAEALQGKPMASLGWGFLSFILFWIVALPVALVVVILLGIFLGVLTLGGLSATVIISGLAVLAILTTLFVFILTYFTEVVVGYWAGKLLLSRFAPSAAENIFWCTLLGVLLIAIVASIPVLGWLAVWVATFFGLGALLLFIRSKLQKQPAAIAEPLP